MKTLNRIEQLKEMTLTLSDSPLGDYKKVTAMFGAISDVVAVLTEKNREQQKLLEEKEKLERRGKISEARYKAVFDSSPDALFLMQDNNYIECNISVLNLFGCSKKDILTQSPLKFSPLLQPNGVKSTLGVKQHVTAALQGLEQNFNWRHLRLDRTPFDVRIRLSRVGTNEDGWLIACLHEIKRRKHEISIFGR